MNYCGDSARVAHPLFQVEDGGSIPTSPLQLTFGVINSDLALKLNSIWHSRLPNIGNHKACFCYGAEYNGVFYAIAMWSNPIAREFNGRNYFELRRMAVANDAPKFSASRFLGWMARDIKKRFPKVVKLISYQDTFVHDGTIYKASGWKNAYFRDRGKEKGWGNRHYITQTKTDDGKNSPKIRWEKDL